MSEALNLPRLRRLAGIGLTLIPGEVASGASYKIVGNTGSAWVLTKRGKRPHELFYFWVTRGHANSLGSERLPLVRRMGGVAIFSDGLRLAWKLRRATAWIEGVGSRAPKLHMLNPLVATSTSFSSFGCSRRG